MCLKKNRLFPQTLLALDNVILTPTRRLRRSVRVRPLAPWKGIGSSCRQEAETRLTRINICDHHPYNPTA